MNDCRQMEGVTTALDALAAAANPVASSNIAQHHHGQQMLSHLRHYPPGGTITDVDCTTTLRRSSSSPPAYLHARAPPPSAKRPRTSSRMRFLRSRELDIGTIGAVPEELRTWIEGETLRKLDTGEYVSLDKNAERVRSTISISLSHDGKYFASTHGDHSVKVFEYPSRNQIACLDGHPRTPWTVCFHPNNSNLVASGCLGSECRVWNVSAKKCVRKHTFRGSISCVSFNPSGELLAVTSGKSLLLWNYKHPTPGGGISSTAPPAQPQHNPGNAGVGPAENALPNGLGNAPNNNIAEQQNEPVTPLNQHLPVELLAGSNPFHMVDFHPSGRMLMTGEKNKTQAPNQNGNANEEPPVEEQFTLKIIVHHFDRRMGVKFAPPVLIVPRVVAYNDAGIHFSPCGKMLAACVPVSEKSQKFHIAVLSIYPNMETQGYNGKKNLPVGSVLYKSGLDQGHVTALTNLKFSSTSKHLLAGFSFRPQNPVLRIHAEQYGEMAMAAGRLPGRNGGRQEYLPCGAPVEPRLPQVRVVDIYRVDSNFKCIRSLGADVDITENNGGAEDEINVAVFAPRDGLADGIIYGTQKGRIRMFQQASGRKRYPSGICDANCAVENKHRVPYIMQPVNSNATLAAGLNTRNIGSPSVQFSLGSGSTTPNATSSALETSDGAASENVDGNGNGVWHMNQNHPIMPVPNFSHIHQMNQMNNTQAPNIFSRIAHPPLPYPPNTTGRAQSAPPGGMGGWADQSFRRILPAWRAGPAHDHISQLFHLNTTALASTSGNGNDNRARYAATNPIGTLAGTSSSSATPVGRGAPSTTSRFPRPRNTYLMRGTPYGASGNTGRQTAMAQPSMMISQNSQNAQNSQNSQNYQAPQNETQAPLEWFNANNGVEYTPALPTARGIQGNQEEHGRL